MLEYGMTKGTVLAEVYPDEVGFLLDMAEERKAATMREITLAMHADPEKNLARLGAKPSPDRGTAPEAGPKDVSNEKGAMQLAAWAGNTDLMRRIQLYRKAAELTKAARNGG